MLHAVALVPVSGGAREGDRQREVWRGRERGEGGGGTKKIDAGGPQNDKKYKFSE